MPKIQDFILHKANHIQTNTRFQAVFNAVTPGHYDYTGTTACQNVVVMQLSPGAVYWIKTISSGANIPVEDYTGSVVNLPQLTIRISPKQEAYFRYPHPIDKYLNNAEFGSWILSSVQANMTLSLSGLLVQLPSMVGILTVDINVSLGIYEINNQFFAGRFRM